MPKGVKPGLPKGEKYEEYYSKEQVQAFKDLLDEQAATEKASIEKELARVQKLSRKEVVAEVHRILFDQYAECYLASVPKAQTKAQKASEEEPAEGDNAPFRYARMMDLLKCGAGDKDVLLKVLLDRSFLHFDLQSAEDTCDVGFMRVNLCAGHDMFAPSATYPRGKEYNIVVNGVHGAGTENS
jgi:hypothetical protein